MPEDQRAVGRGEGAADQQAGLRVVAGDQVLRLQRPELACPQPGVRGREHGQSVGRATAALGGGLGQGAYLLGREHHHRVSRLAGQLEAGGWVVAQHAELDALGQDAAHDNLHLAGRGRGPVLLGEPLLHRWPVHGPERCLADALIDARGPARCYWNPTVLPVPGWLAFSYRRGSSTACQ